MPDMHAALFILLFTYGLTLSYHVMGSTKFYILKKFKWRNALLGVYQELGYFLFLFILFMIPLFIDLESLKVDLQLDNIVTVVLVFPLVGAIKKCYEKSIEVKKIDISEIDNLTEDGEINAMSMLRSDKELNVNVTLKGDIDYGKKEQKATSRRTKQSPKG